MKWQKSLVGFVTAACISLASDTAFAGPFTYAVQDLMLCFRKTGGTSDLEVNLGQASKFYNATPGSSFTVTNFTAAQLTAAFGSSYANVSWSVAGAMNVAGDPNAPRNTLWVSAPRTDTATQSTPWEPRSITAQGNTVAPVLTVGSGFASASGTAASPTTAAVIANGANSYADNIGSNGDFGQFQGNIENTLASTFVSGGSVARSDFYQLTPNAANATYLGYFELSQAGALSFVAVPESGTYAAALGAGLMAFALFRAHRKSLAHS